MINVQLPSQLCGLASGQKNLLLQANTLKEVFYKIDEIAPMIRSQIFDSSGNVRQFVGVFLNEQQINDLENGAQQIHPDSQIVIVMSVAGG
ncbi:MAG: hypothetical protein ACN6N2_10020 [Acinetobacter calcoaceticus]